jgi:CP family cyanate transporter-like MFS transporter
VLLILAWVAAFSLRSGFIGLGPALPALTADLRLSFSQASFLVAVPTLMMGVMAVPGGALADRWGPVRVIALGLALVAVGGGFRAAAAQFAVLLALTFVFGAGIGLSQPSLPRLMRSRFPRHLGATTGIYASGLASGGILGAFLSATLVARGGGEGSWRMPLALWGAVAGVSLVAWALTLQPWRSSPSAGAARTPSTPRLLDSATVSWSPWRDRRAWIAALLFAAQGIVYYLLVAWLPAIYGEAGASGNTVAALFAVFNAATLPGMLLFPLWSDRLHRRRPPTVAASVIFLLGLLGLMLMPLADPWRWLWPVLAGFAVAGLFAMCLVLPADIAPRGRTGAAAGMMLGIGYAASALGPVIAGVVRDVSGSFAATLAMLPVFGIAIIVLSMLAPELRDRTYPETD